MREKTSTVVIRHTLLIIVFLISMGPLFLLFMNSFKPSEEFNTSPFGLPSRITFENIISAWTEGNYAGAYMNSAFIGIIVIIVICVAGGMCAYPLAKMKFKGSTAVMGALLLTMSVPMGLFLVPLFFLWQRFGLMDSFLGLIIIYSGIWLPFHIFLLRSFFVGIPKEISECAKVDGCNEIQVLAKIILPISKPAFLTVALLVGLWTWNEFFFANAFIQSDEFKPVSTKYLTFAGAYSFDWSKVMAAGLIAVLPVLIAYLFLQRRFIEGITSGSVKG